VCRFFKGLRDFAVTPQRTTVKRATGPPINTLSHYAALRSTTCRICIKLWNAGLKQVQRLRPKIYFWLPIRRYDNESLFVCIHTLCIHLHTLGLFVHHIIHFHCQHTHIHFDFQVRPILLLQIMQRMYLMQVAQDKEIGIFTAVHRHMDW
jgi:hypothetical protein